MNRKDNQYDSKLVQHFFDTQYIDRGMMKWQGFFISDHTVAIKQNHNDDQRLYSRVVSEVMNQNEIRTVITKAIEKDMMVAIQLNERNQDLIFKNIIEAKISGFEGDTIYLSNRQFVSVSMIRTIKLLE